MYSYTHLLMFLLMYSSSLVCRYEVKAWDRRFSTKLTYTLLWLSCQRDNSDSRKPKPDIQKQYRKHIHTQSKQTHCQ